MIIIIVVVFGVCCSSVSLVGLLMAGKSQAQAQTQTQDQTQNNSSPSPAPTNAPAPAPAPASLKSEPAPVSSVEAPKKCDAFDSTNKTCPDYSCCNNEFHQCLN